MLQLLSKRVADLNNGVLTLAEVFKPVEPITTELSAALHAVEAALTRPKTEK